jgi:hypothetical protein
MDVIREYNVVISCMVCFLRARIKADVGPHRDSACHVMDHHYLRSKIALRPRRRIEMGLWVA